MKDKIKVAFQGEKGAYSHLACLEIFPFIEATSCATFEEAFQLAKDNSEYKIVIPIENSLAGRVADIHYLIPKYKLQIHAEHFQKVTHNLLGIKGSKINDIKTVRSHAQALGQSQKFIIDNKLIPIISADTAGSAKFVSEKNNKSDDNPIRWIRVLALLKIEIKLNLANIGFVLKIKEIFSIKEIIAGSH